MRIFTPLQIPALVLAPRRTPIQFPVLRREDIAELVPGMEIALLSDVWAFQSALRQEAARAQLESPFTRRFHLHARTVDAAAHALVPLLVYVETKPNQQATVPLQDGVLSCTPIRSKQSFFRDGHAIRLYVHFFSVSTCSLISF